jgi:glycosyltransferase involved in cell wall biosynthesis/lipopolysaccharide/colanic/teichoic acid biosynthesis glycosyltransferase
MSYRLMRITTVPLSLHKLLRGQMSYMKSQGFDVLMVSADGPELEQVVKNEDCPHVVVPMTRKITPWQDILCLIQLIRLIRKFRPDIVHSHTPKAGLLGMLAAKITGVPIRIHTIAGLPLTESKGLKKAVLKIVERVTAWASQHVYVNSQCLADYIKVQKILSNSINLKVIGKGSSNGIDLSNYKRNTVDEDYEKQILETSEIKRGGRVWLFVGRLVKDKGVFELFNAFCEVQKRYPNDQLWLVGPTEDGDSLNTYIENIILNHPGVKMWGYQENVKPFMKLASALVLPSYREGFPNVALQAAAMECPMILSDINGCNELVTDGFNGLLVPIKCADSIRDAIFKMRTMEAQKISFVKKSKKLVVKQFDQTVIWKAIKDEYFAAIRKLNEHTNHGFNVYQINKINFYFKRSFDFGLALILILLSTVPFIIIYFSLRSLSGRVFEINKRIGYRGKVFLQYKFYTGSKIISDNLFLNSICYYLKEVLSVTYLKGLPQLYNVLIGDMSFVGPRAISPYVFYNIDLKYVYRMMSLPGITGYAQVRDKLSDMPEHQYSNDIFYLKIHTLFLDIKIIYYSIFYCFSSEHLISVVKSLASIHHSKYIIKAE